MASVSPQRAGSGNSPSSKRPRDFSEANGDEPGSGGKRSKSDVGSTEDDDGVRGVKSVESWTHTNGSSSGASGNGDSFDDSTSTGGTASASLPDMAGDGEVEDGEISG